MIKKFPLEYNNYTDKTGFFFPKNTKAEINTNKG